MRCLLAFLLFCSLSVVSVQAQEMPEPSREHTILKNDVGTWKAVVTMWMEPGAPPSKMEGVETNRMLGPFWVISDFKGELMGMPFTGHSQSGYDPKMKKFVGSWIDSVSPHAMHMVGEFDDETDTFTFKTKGMNPMGEPTEGKTTLTYKDKDHRSMVMYDIVDGEEVKTMAIEYTRMKDE